MSVDDVRIESPGLAQRLADAAALTKPRLNGMAVFAVAAGWWAEVGVSGSAAAFAATLAGAGLVAGGASALNQVLERDRDVLMVRTRERPVPAGRVAPGEAAVFGGVLSVLGLALLAVASTPLATALAAATLVSYVLVYTPLKTRTSLNTLVGTLPGALPPLIGAAAASGQLSPAAWFLFALIAAWQLPHFLAIAWLYRDDYARAGYAMLPVVTDGSGATGRQVVVQSLLTLLVSMCAVPLGLAGTTYFVIAAAAGAGLVACGALFALRRRDADARLVLRASLVHLPLVLVAFALCR